MIQLPSYDSTNVLIIGDVMVDSYVHGHAQRISPEAPVPVVKITHRESRPGGAGNVALNIRALNCSVNLLGVTGQDETAELLKASLDKAKINHYFLACPEVPTICKERVISHHQQLIRLDQEESLVDIDKSMLYERMQVLISNMDVVIISDYAKGTLSNIQDLIQLAKQHDVPVFVDPKGQDFTRYQGASLLTPNRKEFELVVGKCHSQSELVTKAQALLEDLALDNLLITRGEEGMTLVSSNNHVYHIPAQAREVYDVTGAGDTVIAVLAASYAAGSALIDAVHLANIAAGIVVGHLGVVAIKIPELQHSLNKLQGLDASVITEQQLLHCVEQAKIKKERIVFTNGCFDILHPGHVHYLEQAKQLGDRLIVAVNDDQSVKKLKGSSRPINQLSHRMTVLAALGSVDWVVAFSESTPERLIKKISPDILVKGGDYKVSEIAGHEHVLAGGGEVKILDFRPGYSTSEVINRMLTTNRLVTA